MAMLNNQRIIWGYHLIFRNLHIDMKAQLILFILLSVYTFDLLNT